MKKFGLTLMLFITLGSILASTSTFNTLASQVMTPTPVGIVSIQGANNLGQIQLFSLPQIIDRTGVLAWHQKNWTGYGVKVGILDQAFGKLIDLETAAGVTVTLPPYADKNEYSSSAATHGTDVTEVIHAVAPRAELFACRYTTFDEYVSCIDWMISANVKVINHSAGVPALPLDGTNVWAKEVDRAARAGVLWVNAAGNFANGYINDFFTDTNLNTYHEFRGSGVVESLAVNPINQQGRVLLSWEDSNNYAANAINFDLEVIDAGNNVIASSSQPQDGNPGEIPLEYTLVDMNKPFGVRVRNVDGQGENVRFVMFVEFVSLPGGIGRESIIAPGDSLNALTVGALQGNSVAPYSSRGPLVSGAIKPDLVASGEILLSDGRVFVGTSAAAPIVAGVAALVWEANPAWTREQLYNDLIASVQDDSMIPGMDSVYGRGRIYVPDIVITAVAVAPTNTLGWTQTGTFSITLTPDFSPLSTEVTLTPSVTETSTINLQISDYGVRLNIIGNLKNVYSTTLEPLDTINYRQTVKIIGVNSDNTWFRVKLEDRLEGWIWRGGIDNWPEYFGTPLGVIDGDISVLENISDGPVTLCTMRVGNFDGVNIRSSPNANSNPLRIAEYTSHLHVFKIVNISGVKWYRVANLRVKRSNDGWQYLNIEEEIHGWVMQNAFYSSDC